jgi:hypothetical protein
MSWSTPGWMISFTTESTKACVAISNSLCRAVEKSPSTLLRSIASLQRTADCTPALVDFSRASHLDFFDQPESKTDYFLSFNTSSRNV